MEDPCYLSVRLPSRGRRPAGLPPGEGFPDREELHRKSIERRSVWGTFEEDGGPADRGVGKADDLCGQLSDNMKFDSIIFDLKRENEADPDYLWDCGHRRIGRFIGGNDTEGTGLLFRPG